jgi:hypothetical protein
MNTVPAIAFSKRTATSVTIFACLNAAQKAFRLTSNPAIMNALHLEHAELFDLYKQARHQDVSNQSARLDAIIAKVVTVVGQLNTTVQMIQPMFRNTVEVQEVQIVIANAVQTMSLVAQAAA